MPEFLDLLARHDINVVADVRSLPYSRFHDQFNRETFAESLKSAGIQYVFLGRELGARRRERDCYSGSQARYDLIAQLPAFHEGLNWLRLRLTAHRITLLCAEKDPVTCHRMVLVCRHLRSEPIEIRHILENGSFETTEQAEMRLLEAVGLLPTHLFRSRAELIEDAYDLQAERIAYTQTEAAPIGNGVPR
ncbi:MAG: DUF488 domain-containing protein [Phycisphaeraceae bacterium]|nr:DUF488 domain-containing protein [Phycisphaeraceae bacterium]